MVNRHASRLLTVSNEVVPPSTQPGELAWQSLPSDHVVLELVVAGSPGGPGADTESVFPLDWAAAVRNVSGELALPFQYLLQRYTLVAHMGSTAAPSDVDALARIVASIRTDPVPTHGTFHGHQVLGPLTSFPVGTVRHFDTGDYTNGVFLVRGARTTFAFIGSVYGGMAGMRPCALRYDAITRVFVCDADGAQWSRTGTQLSGSGYFSLVDGGVLVKDGIVLLGGRGVVPTDESGEFPDPIAPSARPTTILSRTQVLARYAAITRTDPIARAGAKLVPRDALAGILRGALTSGQWPDEPLWVVVFSGNVNVPGFGPHTDTWNVFVADAHTGGLMDNACCEDHDNWPAWFDALPDLATP